jgi:hypothetical protein
VPTAKSSAPPEAYNLKEVKVAAAVPLDVQYSPILTADGDFQLLKAMQRK